MSSSKKKKEPGGSSVLRGGIPGKYIKKDTPPEMPIINVWTTLKQKSKSPQHHRLSGPSLTAGIDGIYSIGPNLLTHLGTDQRPKTLAEKCALAQQNNQFKSPPAPLPLIGLDPSSIAAAGSTGGTEIAPGPSVPSPTTTNNNHHQAIASASGSSTQLVAVPSTGSITAIAQQSMPVGTAQGPQLQQQLSNQSLNQKSGSQERNVAESGSALSSTSSLNASHNQHGSAGQIVSQTGQPVAAVVANQGQTRWVTTLYTSDQYQQQPSPQIATVSTNNTGNQSSPMSTGPTVTIVPNVSNGHQMSLQQQHNKVWISQPALGVVKPGGSGVQQFTQLRSMENLTRPSSLAIASNHEPSQLISSTSSVQTVQPVSTGHHNVWVPANPYLQEEIPQWLIIYSKASRNLDKNLKWEVFRLPELEYFLGLLNRLYREELEQLVGRYEVYRMILQGAIDEQEQLANRHQQQQNHHHKLN